MFLCYKAVLHFFFGMPPGVVPRLHLTVGQALGVIPGLQFLFGEGLGVIPRLRQWFGQALGVIPRLHFLFGEGLGVVPRLRQSSGQALGVIPGLHLLFGEQNQYLHDPGGTSLQPCKLHYDAFCRIFFLTYAESLLNFGYF